MSKRLSCGISSVEVIVYLYGDINSKRIGWADADCFVVIDIEPSGAYGKKFRRLEYDSTHMVYLASDKWTKQYHILKTYPKDCIYLLDGEMLYNNFKE